MGDNITISKQLLESIAKGCRKDFRFLYDHTYPHIYRFVHYFLPHREDCEEVVSEVYYILWKQREKLLHIDDFKSWLYIISRNEAYRFIKLKEKYILSIDELPVELAIDKATVENNLIEQEMEHIYNSAVNELPERCKLVYLMAREQRLKFKEIAEILSVTEGTVEKQMNIAIRKIAHAVAKYYPNLGRKANKR